MSYTKAALTLCKEARSLDMEVQLFMWGAFGGVTDDGKVTYKLYDWHKPDERKAAERYYDLHLYLAPYVTRVVTLMGDPGGGSCPGRAPSRPPPGPPLHPDEFE